MKGPVRKFRRLVERLATENPSPSGAAAVKLGIAKFMLCRFHEAIELFGKGTDNKERRYYQAQCYKCLRQWDKALENLRLAQDRGWDSRVIAIEMADVHCLAGRIDEAEKIIKRVEKASQDDPNWHYVAGMIAELKGDYDTAEERYEQARQIQPGHPAATFRLAYYYDLHGDEEKAIELYLECVTQPRSVQENATGTAPTTEQQPARPIHPILANALLNLAVLYEDAGKYDHAERCLRRILECNPNHARAQLFLKDVLASKNMYFDEDEAKRIARRNDLLAIPVTDFELSVRARNCLKKMNIRTLGDLLRVTEAELLSFKNFGETSLAEIKNMLASKNLRIGQMREEAAETMPVETSQGATISNEGVLAMPISQVQLPVRIRKALDRLNVKTLGELASKSEDELLACPNFGRTSLEEVKRRLAEYGLSLKQNP
ncbi:MAG: RNA polymerase subunit sigma [Candidatus Hydrothermarchaeota archaeon]|nr:MAG: RNA polymerase subunit sigma [Candidatus Hydrothermarchaeota archaeon]